MRRFHHPTLRAQTTGHDHLAILVQRLANGVQRFFHRRINETAGVDDDQIGIIVTGRNLIPFGTQPGSG
jgi:hypothetical protein